MAGGYTIELKGMDRLLRAMRDKSDSLKSEINLEFKETARAIERKAKRDAPKDESFLANSISTVQTKEGFEVVVNNDYAPFMEFGTKGNANPPSEFADYARRFRSSRPNVGGTLQANILEWVKRKRLAGSYSTKTRRRVGSRDIKEQQDRQLAFVIARHIRRYGVKPQPYLFPAFSEERAALIQRLTNILTKS